ncbi:MAG: CoA pyrophosphatase [Pseudomonadota bacterium]
MSFDHGPDLRSRIAGHLARFPALPIADEALKKAAVAIVVGPGSDDGEACTLLTLRPRTIKRHSSQFALPGGRLDAGETSTAAALRELREELGLSLSPDSVLGSLDDYPTRSGFRITPVVAWCDTDMALTPDPAEVDTVYHIPLRELDSPDIPILSPPAEGDRPVLSMLLPALAREMFEPTAAILFQFREVALRGMNTRVAQYDQPAFAWR